MIKSRKWVSFDLKLFWFRTSNPQRAASLLRAMGCCCGANSSSGKEEAESVKNKDGPFHRNLPKWNALG